MTIQQETPESRPFDMDMIQKFYANLATKIDTAKQVLGRHLTLSEKILFAHLHGDMQAGGFVRQESYVDFAPDRVAMQDATAQMALLQFMQAGRPNVAVPSSIHCDHLIMAKSGAKKDLEVANEESREVYDFLASVANKYGIGFWKPGSGIIHQIVLENYAFPGGMMIGTDSHTVNAGGLGMIAIGVGGADACDVMAGLPWELKWPKLIGIKLTGKLSGWCTPKDVILKVASILTVKGGTDSIVEYFGEGAENLSCTGKGTICNMGAEIGATTSTFGYDASMSRYLKATGRTAIADLADGVKEYLTGDAECYVNPEQYFDEVIEINLSELEPYLNGPFTPDLATPISKIKEVAAEEGWPTKIEVGLIGSCTNSSYEDLSRAVSVIKQMDGKNLSIQSEFDINPGSEQVRCTCERDGILPAFESAGATIFTNACGPCIGMWDRMNADKQERNTIVHSFNRNFAKRADGNPNTFAFVASPELVAALVIAGDLNNIYFVDGELGVWQNNQLHMLQAPTGDELPVNGFIVEDNGYQAPAEDGSKVAIIIDADSKRLQLLAPFESYKNDDFEGLRLLIKVKGKCTTDHISMAGPWLKFRGHLDNISNNMLIGATNTFNHKTDFIKNQITGEYGPVPGTQRAYKVAGLGSIVVGEENYGEGSSREHAAMEPRFLGVRAVLTKSFARIHETNLKKQGVLAVTFADKADYDKIHEDTVISFTDINKLAPGRQLRVLLSHIDDTEEIIMVNHTYNQQQIEWFKEGAALNIIRKNAMATAEA